MPNKTPSNLEDLAQQFRKRYPAWAQDLKCLGHGTCRAETMDIDMSGIIFQHNEMAVVVCDNGNVSGAYRTDQFVFRQ